MLLRATPHGLYIDAGPNCPASPQKNKENQAGQTGQARYNVRIEYGGTYSGSPWSRSRFLLQGLGRQARRSMCKGTVAALRRAHHKQILRLGDKTMTKARTVALLLAAVALSAASPLAQAGTTTTFHTVRYDIDRDWSPDVWYEGVVLPPPDHNWNSNTGAGTQLRTKSWQHMYHGDWDTDAMQLDIDPGGPLTDWGSYTPNYYMAIRPVTVGPPADPPGPPPAPQFPDAATPAIVNISAVWSETDWIEGDGDTNYNNYNWTNPIGTHAATYMYAGDTLMAPMAIPWIFPGGGIYPRDVDCAFLGTFLTHGDVRDDWSPSTMESKTPTNSQPFSLSKDNYYLDDNGTPADPNDDSWVGMYTEVQLDQAMMDDMLQNSYNRGLTLWNLTDWYNKNIYSDDQNAACWPYIEARIEVLEGDANLDKAVDGLDYVAWSNNYNQAAVWETGDFNDDQFADGLDYVVWSNNYGATLPAAPGAAVPDPATMALLAVGGLALLKRRSRS